MPGRQKALSVARSRRASGVSSPFIHVMPVSLLAPTQQMWRSATVVSAAPNVLIRAARAYARIGSGWKSAAAEPKCAPLPFRAFAQDPVALALQGGLFRCSKQDEDGHGEAGGGGGGGGRGGGKGGRDAEAEVDAEAQGKERRRRDRALQRAGKAEDKDEEPENRGRQIKQKERKKGKDSGREGVAPVKRGAAGAAAAAPAFVPAVHDLSLLEPLSPCLTGMSGLLAADFLVRWGGCVWSCVVRRPWVWLYRARSGYSVGVCQVWAVAGARSAHTLQPSQSRFWLGEHQPHGLLSLPHRCGNRHAHHHHHHHHHRHHQSATPPIRNHAHAHTGPTLTTCWRICGRWRSWSTPQAGLRPDPDLEPGPGPGPGLQPGLRQGPGGCWWMSWP